MARLALIREIGDYLYLTFPLRRLLLLIIVALSVVFGPFLFSLPPSVRLDFAYVYVGITSVAAFCMYGAFKEPFVQVLGSVIFGGKYKTREYTAPGIKHILRKMGVVKKVKVYVTTNPWIKGPYTNALTCKIYIPMSWLNKFARKEILAIIGHELGHVKNRRRFGFEMAVAMGGVVVVTFVLALFSIPLIVEIFEFALAMLAMTFVSWHNERRADLEGAKGAGPEGLISVFEQLKTEAKRDDGSETHPPLSDRIKRLMKLLESKEE